jgi:hypothetical protein
MTVTHQLKHLTESAVDARGWDGTEVGPTYSRKA